MRFHEVVLQARDPAALAAWYRDTLGLPPAAGGAAVQAGATRLRFEPAAVGSGPIYHFAFNVPEDRIEDALAWIRPRAPVLDADEGPIVHYPDWDAHAVYFRDPAGNVGELIARHALPNASPAPFGATSLLEVSEVGLPAPSVPELNARLKDGLRIAEYRRAHDRFAPLGDEHGLLILVPEGRAWFPAHGEARPHPVRIVHEGPAFDVPSLPYRFLPAEA